jgi:hypothetical protein
LCVILCVMCVIFLVVLCVILCAILCVILCDIVYDIVCDILYDSVCDIVCYIVCDIAKCLELFKQKHISVKGACLLSDKESTWVDTYRAIMRTDVRYNKEY